MLFTNREPGDSLNDMLFFDGEQVKFNTSGKFLDLVIDSSHDYKDHILMIWNKISKMLGIFYKLKQNVPGYILLNLYYTSIYPYLLYCNVIWGGTHVTALAPVIILPKKIVRLIAGQHFLADTNPLFIWLKILKVDDLHKYELALYMYCHTNNFAHKLRAGYGTRHFQSFVPEFQRLAGTQRSLSCHWENCLHFVYAPRCVSYFYAPNCINAAQKVNLKKMHPATFYVSCT